MLVELNFWADNMALYLLFLFFLVKDNCFFLSLFRFSSGQGFLVATLQAAEWGYAINSRATKFMSAPPAAMGG